MQDTCVCHTHTLKIYKIFKYSNVIMFSIILCKKQALPHSSTTSLQNPAVFHAQRAQHQGYTNWVTELQTWKTQPFH